MSNLNTYGDISPRTAGFAVRKLLDRMQPLLVTERFGVVDPQPKNATKTRKWRRYEALARATAPLAEGVPPVGQKLTYTDVTATLEQYGDAVELTDVILDTHEDPILNESIDLCKEQAVESIEVVRFAVLKAGTNVQYATGATTRATVDAKIDRGMLRKIQRGFKRNRARPISTIIKASALVSTAPVAPAFFVVGHTDLESDIRGITGFVPVDQYSNSDKGLPGEIGKVESFRFILTDLLESWQAAGVAGTTYLSGGAAVTTNTACDVYPVLFFAQNAYGIVPLQGAKAIIPAVVNPKPSSGDPCGQKGWVSWKTYQATAILQQLFMCRGEVAATANPT